MSYFMVHAVNVAPANRKHLIRTKCLKVKEMNDNGQVVWNSVSNFLEQQVELEHVRI